MTLGFYKTLNHNFIGFLFNCRHLPRFLDRKSVLRRHFLAPVTIDLKNARPRLRERKKKKKKKKNLSLVSFLFGRRERERGIYTHTHDDESFSRFKSVPFFSRSLKGHAFYSHLSLSRRRLALPSARIVFSPSQTQIHRERVSESAFTRVVVVVA